MLVSRITTNAKMLIYFSSVILACFFVCLLPPSMLLFIWYIVNSTYKYFFFLNCISIKTQQLQHGKSGNRFFLYLLYVYVYFINFNHFQINNKENSNCLHDKMILLSQTLNDIEIFVYVLCLAFRRQ